LQVEELIASYEKDGFVGTWVEKLRVAAGLCLHLKGLAGSLDAVLAAATYKLTAATQLFILHDQEEAAYFYSDLQALLGPDVVLLYPASHNVPYTPIMEVHTDQLVRAEVVQRICHPARQAPLVVTYPAALLEKVVHQEVLSEHTWSVQEGEELTTSTVIVRLLEQGFERVDFVYEAGQFAVRGGVIDIFSYAYQLPFRLVLWGNQVESVRTFDPTNQRSVESIPEATILPSLQAQTNSLARQSLLDCLSPATPVWIKDRALVLAALEQSYAQANQVFQEKSAAPPTAALPPPSLCWETPAGWTQSLQRLVTIEFGNRFHGTPHEVFKYEASAQLVCNQNFVLLAENLRENQSKGLDNIITAESTGQFDRLRSLLAPIDDAVHFKTLSLGLRQGFVDHQVGIACYTDHQIFERYYRYKTPKRYSKTKAVTLRALQALQPGDYVVHIDHGIGRFAGLSKVKVNDKSQEVIRLLYKDDDLVYVNLQSLHKISKYTGQEGVVPAITKLGSSAWSQKKSKVKEKIKSIAKELIQLYSKRKQAPGFSFSSDGFLQAQLESSFIYEDTPDQLEATKAVKKDMEAPYPMDRLVCGDVGFGKTEVAIRAAFKAINDGKQVAVLVPTTILALQHYHSFCARLAHFDVNIAYVNRFKTAQETRTTLEATAAGKVQILIGTHRILSKTVQFQDLGLLIIDEEQKFGVKAKDYLKQLRVNVDVLTLTATPIPRTLHFSLMGARDLSVIATPPPNRQPVDTSIHTFDPTVIGDAINYELQRGGQVFFVHNRVGDIEEVAHMIHKLVPDCRIGVVHGRMEGSRLEQRMLRFIQGAYDVLVATSIIESGLDIPNTNTIFINNSHLFGLSDLHQMRGRVGRSNRKAFCYLLAPPVSMLTAEARARLSALEEFSDLGDGFKVAMRDLDIRGAGDLLGAEQSGFIADVGFDTYCKILDDTVQELKEGEFKALFAQELQERANTPAVIECALETDLEVFIPDTYVSNVAERISLYTRLDRLQDHTALQAFQQELQDRFGPLPLPVQTLIQLVELRWLAQTLGLTKLKLKNGAMRCYFTPSAHSHQDNVLARVFVYVQQHPRRCRIQEVKAQLLLVIDHVADMEQARNALGALCVRESQPTFCSNSRDNHYTRSQP
jgi:transcription-repair coupling factor (superfamily II helicase)